METSTQNCYFLNTEGSVFGILASTSLVNGLELASLVRIYVSKKSLSIT